ncbi:4Fe-4S binding protein [Clostridium lacusfryxellense]|uniref:4Fe-4S binding protein n=1 Tax=Clostridium lacusfryxellense TaxID=205328 RepID=UPI001C0C3832|nr:4Fe-4S binding protein [Clostridium lacusfryxellense]MBU3114165.1 4Fe-4S binding protein [Clostridium lacusfryxellense]
MENQNDLSDYITKRALAQGAILVGYTKIRVLDPVIIFGFPFTDKWFLKEPLNISKLLKKEYSISKHVQNITSKILKSEGYTTQHKSIMSVYGDFRPLAVSAGLGVWGRNGIIVNNDYGAGILFAATFTNAPLKPSFITKDTNHCTNCDKCINACPGKAFENNTFHVYRCIPNTIKGCNECLKVCTKNACKS